MAHSRYQQFYKGYKIMYGEFFLHAKEGRLITANGKMLKGFNKNPVINVSKEMALKSAMIYLPAGKYAWQIPQLEDGYKEVLHDRGATYKPRGDLVWICNDQNDNFENAATYELAYMFDIYPASMNGKKNFCECCQRPDYQVVPTFSTM